MQKTKLELLSDQVFDAQHKVEDSQANLGSIIEKLNKFEGLLSEAEARRAKTLSNKKLLEEIVQNAHDLKENSSIAVKRMVEGDLKTKGLASELKSLIDKLIYAAEMINKISEVLIRKKTVDALISDELMSIMANINTDANQAIELTLIALNSTFEAQSANIFTQSTGDLMNQESLELYEMLTHTKSDGTSKNLIELLDAAYSKANTTYEYLLKAIEEVNNQLDLANADLENAKLNLQSLEISLAAANAEALAS